MRKSKLCLAVVGAVILSGCVEYPNADDPATAAAYAVWKECTRKQAVSRAYVNEKPGWVAAESLVRCYREETAFKEKAGMAEHSANFNQLWSYQWRDLVTMVSDMRARHRAQ